MGMLGSWRVAEVLKAELLEEAMGPPKLPVVKGADAVLDVKNPTVGIGRRKCEYVDERRLACWVSERTSILVHSSGLWWRVQDTQ